MQISTDENDSQVWQTAAEGTRLVFIESGDDDDVDMDGDNDVF